MLICAVFSKMLLSVSVSVSVAGPPWQHNNYMPRKPVLRTTWA